MFIMDTLKNSSLQDFSLQSNNKKVDYQVNIFILNNTAIKIMLKH